MNEDLGERIRRLRRESGFTQGELGKILNVSAQAVSKWERSKTCPDVMTLPTLASLLGVTTDELLGCEKYGEEFHE